ncbi:MAG: hypothetical protein KAI17_00600 [Thiotrichaceae bacterium]|nr:hypothetical protein [Thiotrichaceae bacterium]
MKTGPRELITPFRPIPLDVPEGMKPNEFFNSTENLQDLSQNNGLLTNPEKLLLYRKALGHSNEFDCSIIFNSSKCILNPLGRPVRRTQLPEPTKNSWNRMNQIMIEYMLEKYPDPADALILAGEASLDATWPLGKHGVPSIRMIHNHFMVFENAKILSSPVASHDNPNLTDSGYHGLFLEYLSDVYQSFFEILDLKVLKPLDPSQAKLKSTGYPRGLPSWEVQGGAEALNHGSFWKEYDMVLLGFLDFYRTLFSLVSSNDTRISKDALYPNQIEDVLLFSNEFHSAARMLRLQVLEDPLFANEIRWRPAYKQLLYRDDDGRLIVTISQNSVGNAITELLGIVIKRIADEEAYERTEEALVTQLLEVRSRLIQYNLGTPIAAPYWAHGSFSPPKKS